MRKFTAMFKARTMEFVRDRGTFFWNLLFPVILVFGFAFAFSGSGNALFKVGVIGNDANTARPLAFLQIEQIEFIPYDEVTGAVERLRRHQLDMVLDLERDEYYLNSEAANGPILRMLFTAGNAPSATAPPPGASFGASVAADRFTEQQVAGEPIRYVDWLVPGVIGMNMMFSCLFGVGFVIVRYRKNGVLKRFKATPVSAFTFVSAQAASRLVIVVITSIVVFAGTNAFLHFMNNGSYLTLLILTTMSILAMISVGLVFASRIKSEELASGLMNLVTFPMLILSGVFFSLEGSPPILRSIAKVLPLTHFTTGARAIMLEGAGLGEIAPHLLFLGILTVALLAISAALFRWE